FFIAIVFLFQLASSLLVGDPGVIPDRSRNPLYGTHVILVVFGFAGLTVSSLYSLMYVLLNRQLKSHKMGLIFRQLPALSVLENMSKLAATTGVVLLGVGLLLGHYIAFDAFGAVDVFKHPIIAVADLFWFGYIAGLVAAKVRNISGVRMGYLSIAAYLLFMTSMVVVLTQFGTFHSFQ
ncbi:MAG: cytochrome c biogenesis protein CcsA, partial [Bradymonadaceae bacterium]